MHAEVGDLLVVQGPVLDEHGREGEIIEVRGAGGAPPYVVRWSGSGVVTLVFPGPDAVVHHRREHHAEADS
ncbi:DUF1918 domain-containing protein [Jiangella endophytica]|uniref:DUF1918 domain-containing protein n=1 Tax=Jiangella endophytica TaxID=1623398 RepID=UPI000E351EA7|nr:DUF1918 domain-containing protein [Jiangella endophytica]